MAAAQKARGSAPLPAKLAGLLREAKWLVMVAAAGYLLLILLTHQAADPGWSRSATAAVVQNAGGRAGAWLSDVLLSLFGWSAFWWVAWAGRGGSPRPADTPRRPRAPGNRQWISPVSTTGRSTRTGCAISPATT